MLNLLVLRAREPRRLASFYEELGLSFCIEKHGVGPEHMACDTGSGVLEIYPLNDDVLSTRTVRLGFAVTGLAERCERITQAGGKLRRPPSASSWGMRATIEDPEGHVIDLTEVAAARTKKVADMRREADRVSI
jgi:lactoylglutathione lyase